MNNIKRNYIAVDLGASSGRLVAGKLDNGKLDLEEIHRFWNGGINFADRLQWGVPTIWRHIVDGLTKAHKMFGDNTVSIGVDAWGVDFGLLGENDTLLANPYHYRDSHIFGVLDQAFKVASREEIFAESGVQFMEINTLYQFFALMRDKSPLLDNAKTFLMIGDLFHWLLSGEKSNEQTSASNSQLYNPQTADWSHKLMDQFGIPKSIFQEIVLPGTNLGKLRNSVAEASGLNSAEVVLPGTHDTASAVVSVPAKSSDGVTDWCYISSGTWSLMGVEIPKPIVNQRVRELNFTNEGGVGQTTRLLKNIAGLWLVQECRRIWNTEGKEYDWDGLTSIAQQSKPLVTLIDPDHSNFAAPASMPKAIASYCSQKSLEVPTTDGAFIRCILESLALRYRMVLEWLEELVGNKLETIYIVGGGTQNKLLCQMAADACNRRVVAGPIEATAIGNIVMQATAMGDIGSIHEGREIISKSFEVVEYLPSGNDEQWNEAFERFQSIKQG